MSLSGTYSVAQSNAFLEEFELGPWCGGALSGLQFAVSELIDVEGHATGCGNPAWLENRPPSACNALCLDILLSAGAQCTGRTKADEFTFSLHGESPFTGTPLNPRAPERVPGGSASGAASAVACGLVHFAIALDSGASTQVSAGNCGLYGYRSAPGVVPLAGVLPVAPSFDTIGILASSPQALLSVSSLFARQESQAEFKRCQIYLLEEAWAKAEPAFAAALKGELSCLEQIISPPAGLSLKSLCAEEGGGDLYNWYQTYTELYCMESWSSIGTWIEDRKPELGQEAKANIYRSRMIDRSESAKFFRRREIYASGAGKFLGEDRVVLIPATPDIAPLRGFISSPADPGDYYPSALALSSLSAVGRLFQLTIPITEIQGAPAGVTLLAANDDLLLGIMKRLGASKHHPDRVE